MRLLQFALFPVLVALVSACASPLVPEERMPKRPVAPVSGGGGVIYLLATESAPLPVADEFRELAGAAGRAVDLASGEPLAAVCENRNQWVLRPNHERTHYATNTRDRNAMFMYETIIIVGIPVTLISAATWKWYAETVVAGELEIVSCSQPEGAAEKIVDSYRLRSEGTGFIRTEPLREAQLEAALRSFARELFAAGLARSNE